MQHDIRHDLVLLLPRLRRFGYTLSGSMPEADDLVQSACARALARLDQFEPGSRLDSWMFRIMQTLWIDQKRSSFSRLTVFDEAQVLAAVADEAVHEAAEARDALALVRREMLKLPEEQRVVLSLVAIDGRSYQETADILEIPIGTVMSRLARARKKLSDALDQPMPSTSRRVR